MTDQTENPLTVHPLICSDQMLGREGIIRLHALNIAAAQRREGLRFLAKDDEDKPYDGGLAKETLVDAQMYAQWLAGTEGDKAPSTVDEADGRGHIVIEGAA